MQNNTPYTDRDNPEIAPRLKALAPFFVFIVFYLGLSLYANDFYKVPMPVAFLLASAVALLLNRRQKLADKVEIFARGMGDCNIMIMCLIFILAGAFAATAKGMGAVDAAVLLARSLIPDNLMLAGMFLVSCFISLAIGTSCGTIAALIPIALGLIGPLQLSPPLLIGAVIGGAMFGDNMSMISDTTIAATRTQNVAMRDKFIINLKMIIPAALLCMLLYVLCGKSGNAMPVAPLNGRILLSITPYVLILLCALAGMNVMALLFFSTILAALIGICTGAFDFWVALDLIGKGTLGMSETLIVAILAGGLLSVIRHNGGIEYLMRRIRSHIHTVRGCELGICVLVALINLFTANNTVAIVIAGPLAKELSDKYGCVPKRVASILDTASCAVQGLIPYGAQILIAIGVAQTAGVPISSLDVITSLYYPWLLGIALFGAIIFHRRAIAKEGF